MRLGLIGAGHWGKCYINTINEMPNVTLQHVVSKNPNTRSLLPKSCQLSTHWGALLNDKTIEGVILAVPPTLHATLATAMFETGLPVLIEKPMALSLSEAQQICTISQEKKALAIVGHTHLYSDAFRELKNSVNKLGDVQKVISIGGNWGPFRTQVPMMWDYAPHDIAMCLDLLDGYPTEVSATRVDGSMVEAGERGETVVIDLTFERKMHAHITVSNIAPLKQRYFEVKCDKGSVIYNDIEHINKLKIHYKNQLDHSEIAIAKTKPLTNLVHDFCQKIESGTKECDSLALGLKVVEILEKCQKLLN